jgi:hypothetical protein
MDRLVLLHNVMTRLVGGYYAAPIDKEKTRRILDIGTGNGACKRQPSLVLGWRSLTYSSQGPSASQTTSPKPLFVRFRLAPSPHPPHTNRPFSLPRMARLSATTSQQPKPRSSPPTSGSKSTMSKTHGYTRPNSTGSFPATWQPRSMTGPS